jgi:hypothetical protein
MTIPAASSLEWFYDVEDGSSASASSAASSTAQGPFTATQLKAQVAAIAAAPTATIVVWREGMHDW